MKTCDRNTMANVLPEESCTELDLEKEMLTSLPTEIVLLVNLTALDLEHNRLVSLPPEVGQLVHLTSLNLGDNQLATLPAEVGLLVPAAGPRRPPDNWI